MSLMNVIHIAGTGMNAQTTRLNIIASNLSNQDSVADSNGKTFRAREPVFQAIQIGKEEGVSGVKVASVVESQEPLRRELRPGSPLADEDGYVSLPNVNPISEMANMIAASRSYQEQVQLTQAAKSLI